MPDIRETLRKQTLEAMDVTADLTDDEVRSVIETVILEYGRRHYLSLEDKCTFSKELFYAIRGYDVLEELLLDDEVSEIMVNGYGTVFFEKSGKITLWEKSFASPERLMDVIQKMAAGANRVVNESSPIADTRLPSGCRVNIILPPIALDGPALTIRKFSKRPYTLERLCGMGAISKEACNFLIEAVKEKKNLFISGGTGSGKTTFLNALSEYIPHGERVITIEDAAELQLQGLPNLVRMEVRKATAEGCSEISVRDLIKAALRMRPDRIIVGEVRGGEALDMLQAMNTGHEGSLSTGHANSAKDMISRLETMVLQAGDMPLYAIRKQIASAVDIFVHLTRFRDGSRGMREICVNEGMQGEEIRLRTVFSSDKK